MSLGSKIKQLRERNGIPQKDFAKRIGVSNVVLSRYESGERKPDYETLIKIADFFEVTTDFLLGRETITNNQNKESLFPFDQVGISQKDFENLSTYQQEVLEWAVNADGLFFKNKSDNILDMMERLEIAYEVNRVMEKRKKQ